MTTTLMDAKPARVDSFVWTDHEVGLLLRTTLKYKTAKCGKNVDWEFVQVKYSDICEGFLKKQPTEASRSKEFPHNKENISKAQVTSKLKAIWAKYRQTQDGSAAIVVLCCYILSYASRFGVVCQPPTQ